MIRNMGTWDRVARVGFALLVAVLWLTGTIGGLVALVLAVLAVVFVLTATVGTCPLYMPFGISTLRRPRHRTVA